MKIKVHAYGGEQEDDVLNYVQNGLDVNDYDAGIMETNRDEINNLRGAFARLCNILATKGILDAEEIVEITCGYTYPAEYTDDN